MPLVGSALRAKFKDTIFSGLKRELHPVLGQGENYVPEADKFLEKIANAIADIAVDLVDEIHNNAQVAPGIQVTTAGSPNAHSGATVAPGKIL